MHPDFSLIKGNQPGQGFSLVRCGLGHWSEVLWLAATDCRPFWAWATPCSRYSSRVLFLKLPDMCQQQSSDHHPGFPWAQTVDGGGGVLILKFSPAFVSLGPPVPTLTKGSVQGSGMGSAWSPRWSISLCHVPRPRWGEPPGI